MSTPLQPDRPVSRDGFLPVGNARLYYREIGRGQPVIILHGGPDFDQHYLLPEMDRLSGSLRLIYYDQRGRGRSGENVQPEEVSLSSEMEDLETLRRHLRLESTALLGHSWGGLLAMEYALRHPERVSHMVLMNTAPVSHDDYLLLRQDRLLRAAGDLEQLKAIAISAGYQQGDLETEAEYYRIHFKTAFREPEYLESVVQRLRTNFTPQGVRKAREIEKQLYDETWSSSNYDLLPRLKQLSLSVLIIHGDHDLIPLECSAHIAQAIPGARLVVLSDCGHFSYLECPAKVREEIEDFFRGVFRECV